MHPSPLRSVFHAFLIVAALDAQQAPEDWTLRLPFATTSAGTMATHPTTGRPVRFGGFNNSIGSLDHLWEWSGDRWLRHVSSPRPDLRSGHAMATDELRHQLVLFGGTSYLPRDTWTWDGSRWQAHPTPLLLTMRTDFAMAFDSQRGRIVLFSGSGATNDTWEWDGSGWLLCQPGAPPTARYGHRMAFDAARGRVVLFGGRSGPLVRDTWEWDGTYWTQRFPVNAPSARSQHAMAYDSARQRIVLHGGSGALPFGSTDTWEWNGADWTQVQTPHSPPTQAGHSLFFDSTSNRTVMFGVLGGIDEVWNYDGADWSAIARGSAPSPRYMTAMTDDPPRGSAVLFGGAASNTNFGDTWTWDGERWLAASPAPAPSARSGHAIAFDAARGVPVLFGGWTYGNSPNPTTYYDDTWTWNGATWTLAQPVNRPPMRLAHGLAYHAASQRLVLFGGGNATTQFGDTWSWDGVNWTQHAPTTSPQARAGAAMSGTTQGVCLFGGFAWTTSPYAGVPLADTWRWDGTNWTQLQPSTQPSARYNAGCTYDADRARMLVFSGLPTPGSATAVGDAWAFDGTDWSLLTPATAPLVRYGASMVHDPRLHETVLFGGLRAGYQNDTWVLGSAGSQNTFGAGCPGSLGTPTLQASPLSIPEPGGTIVVDLANLPTSCAVMTAGFSNTTTGSQPLPLALAQFGMPGCHLLVAPDATLLLFGSTNTARWTLALPFATSLLGVEFFYQAFAWDPAANIVGLTTSNGGRCHIGH